MTMLLGENGLITKAIQSGEQMQIASGKEEIDLQVLGMITEKASQNESCTLEYIKENLPNKLENLGIVGEKGNPLSAFPTITNILTAKEGENTKVTIEANDLNEELGKEGSGIAGYAITASKELPIDALYSKSKTITVTTPGTYHVYVKDNAENLAKRQEIVIE